MKWIILLAIVAVVFATLFYAQQKGPIWDQDQVADSTVLVIQEKGGSATVVFKDKRYYLLTASHVAKELKESSKIVFRLKGDKPSVHNLLPLTKAKSMAWKHHPVADIALIELIPKIQLSKPLSENERFPLNLSILEKTSLRGTSI